VSFCWCLFGTTFKHIRHLYGIFVAIIFGLEHRLRVFENRVLRKVRTFEPNRVEVIGGCRKLCTGELDGSSPHRALTGVIKTRRMR